MVQLRAPAAVRRRTDSGACSAQGTAAKWRVFTRSVHSTSTVVLLLWCPPLGKPWSNTLKLKATPLRVESSLLINPIPPNFARAALASALG